MERTELESVTVKEMLSLTFISRESGDVNSTSRLHPPYGHII